MTNHKEEVENAFKTGMWVGAIVTGIAFALLMYFFPIYHTL
ncbi:MAG TPA: hypothetical protein VNX68_09520 [Nitrosopumilaceae archaeon]|jgi:hypothetical protein|nr:hypothetical protein [Nitrosopumilaceae archaeon]